MVTTMFELIFAIVALTQIQAKVFHDPANHPQIRPHSGPGVMDAQ